MEAEYHRGLPTWYRLQMRANDYLAPAGPASRVLPGYEHRTMQGEMGQAVQHTFEHGGTLVVEAGAGTGKTLAYLLAAALSDLRVVISTATKTLQDQILRSDLPLLEKLLGHPIDVKVLKGISNYVCRRRLEELRATSRLQSEPIQRDLLVLDRWLLDAPSGDRSDLPDLPETAPIWSHVLADPDARIGARCAFHDECLVTRARREAEDARILVVNHHLYFADLAARVPTGSGILPPHDAVVFDEAHHLEDTAAQFFGVRVSSSQVERLVHDAERSLARLATPPEDGSRLARTVLERASGFFACLPRATAGTEGRTSLGREALTGAVRSAAFDLDNALAALGSCCGQARPDSDPLTHIERRSRNIRDALARAVDPADASTVRWAEFNGCRSVIGASPIDVAPILRSEIYDRLHATVLTSATLTTSGSFSFVRQRLGFGPGTVELALHSPFDFGKQAALFIPSDLPDPRDPGYPDRAAEQIRALLSITGGGAFVLCTSLKRMRWFAERLSATAPGSALMQGDAPKNALLDEFRRHGHAVLFATASFWEGVDVPGDALRLVVVDKLPFDVPTDPIVVARCQQLEERGENPFMGYLVPSAALTLKQGFGRLIRTRSDRGIVAILDTRLLTRGYGRAFLRSLPEARRCTTLDEVRAFWQGR